jgi:hypothetical protein
MIPKPVLKKLIDIRFKGAEILFKNQRYQAAIYISGYSIEIALKLKICRLFSFKMGFPETKAEFSAYKPPSSKRGIAIVVKGLKDIRHHRLKELIFYSGVERRVIQTRLNEWNLIAGWDPNMRYDNRKIQKSDAQAWLSSVQILINTFFI